MSQIPDFTWLGGGGGGAGDGRTGQTFFWAEKVLSHISRIDWQPVYCGLGSPPRSAGSSLLPLPPPPSPALHSPVNYGLWVWGSLFLFCFQVSGEDGFRLLNAGFSEFSSPTLGIAGRSLLHGSLSQFFPGSRCAHFCLGFTSPCHSHTATCAHSGCLCGPHVCPSLPAALITLFPMLLFGIFQRL